MTRDDLTNAILKLEQARTDADTAAALAHVKSLAPHARTSDLVFYGERDRTHEEIVEEVFLRERLWAEGGETALQIHIERQLLAALANPDLSEDHYTKVSARTLLEGMRSSIAH